MQVKLLASHIGEVRTCLCEFGIKKELTASRHHPSAALPHFRGIGLATTRSPTLGIQVLRATTVAIRLDGSGACGLVRKAESSQAQGPWEIQV